MFLIDQAKTIAQVRKYCEADNFTRQLHPYLYSYDPKRNFLFCRNPKVCQYLTFCLVSSLSQLKVASTTMMEIFRLHLSGISREM